LLKCVAYVSAHRGKACELAGGLVEIAVARSRQEQIAIEQVLESVVAVTGLVM
jgi:hypothetical protein